MAWRLILPLRNIAGGIRKIPQLHDATAELLPQVAEDFQRWKKLLDEKDREH